MKKTGAKIRLKESRRIGTIQFVLDGKRMEEPVYLNRNGEARWTTRVKEGKHIVGAIFTPITKEVPLLPSTSLDKQFVVRNRWPLIKLPGVLK